VEHNLIHPNYKNFIGLPDSLVKVGYLEGCKILHGDFGNPDSDGNLYNNKLSTNSNQPSSGGTTIKISVAFKPNECYKGINNYLKKEPTNKSKYIFIIAGKDGSDAGGLSKQFSNAVGDHIKTTFMKSIITDTESQAGGAAPAPAEPAEPAEPSAAPPAEPSAAPPAEPAEPSAAAVNNEHCPTKETFDLSPMNFVLPPYQSSIINLAHILAYYAFGVSRINNDSNFDRAKLNLGINFSAFALIVLFDTTGIIQDIIDILETLKIKKTRTTANGNKKKTRTTHKYFQLVTDETVDMPTYKNLDRIRAFKEIDKRIEHLIGKLYAVEELYYRENFTDTFTSQISGAYELQLHNEFFSLLKKFTHTHVQETSNNTANKYTIWNDVIKKLLPKFNNLNLLGTRFRSFYTPKLWVLGTAGAPVLIDLFSLGECIRQKDELSADAIKSIIIYEFTDVSKTQKIIVQGAINQFLNDYKDDKTMLRKFLKFITADISLPSKITCKIFSMSNVVEFTNKQGKLKTQSKPILVHTCFNIIDFYNNTYLNKNGEEITNSNEKITAILEALKVAVNIIEINMRGGARLRRTHSNTTRYKKYHKHTTLRNKQHNKQRKSKKQQYKSIKRVSISNNKKSMRSKRR